MESDATSHCPCGNKKPYVECCEPVIKGTRKAATPEECMRARYSAYTQVEVDFIRESTLPSKRSDHDEEGTRQWAQNSEWTGLEIIRADGDEEDEKRGTVEFIASFSEKGQARQHHELASFVKKDGVWYFEDGVAPGVETYVREEPKVGRNDPCPCGSGKKFKKCCLTTAA